MTKQERTIKIQNEALAILVAQIGIEAVTDAVNKARDNVNGVKEGQKTITNSTLASFFSSYANVRTVRMFEIKEALVSYKSSGKNPAGQDMYTMKQLWSAFYKASK